MFSNHLTHLLIILFLIFPGKVFTQINVSSQSGCAPLINVNFTLSDTGYSNINWDFGDGASSIYPNAIHTFSTPGSYNVVFTAIFNGNPYSDTIPIEVFNNPDAAIEILGDSIGCAPLNQRFIFQ